ncbi:DNA transfer protein [Xenorhabdus bovienii]|uniref:phage DNA ejection protein n=1 Tax=Xenorhabdus bovienii TaxID=40576 RepID=UPI00237C5FDA|nr:phage DNA ejection protein [Xenorhabdus bovienii]MDE1487976.1 DNA transfer protein [Xenorhabdus bovienii]MDE9477758.1 DNA transfer protein [Xenorhabdus bovienii]MDE9530613.1 DNA transfer protein [Xenorhabdus bovienii]
MVQPINYYESLMPDLAGQALKETQNRLGQSQLTGLNLQNQQMQQQMSEQQAFRQALPGAINDPRKLRELAVQYPSQLQNIQAQLGFRSAQDVAALDSTVNQLQLAISTGDPRNVAAALVQNAEVIQSKGVSPQQLMTMYANNPEQFNEVLSTVKLGTLSAKDQFAVLDKKEGREIDRGKLSESIRSSQASESLQARDQDITVRGQNLSAQNSMRTAGGATPSSVREYQYFQSLSPEQQKTYLRVRGRPDAGGGNNSVQLSDGRTVNVSGKLHGSGANAFYEGVDDAGNMVRVPASAIAAPATSAANAQNYAMKKDIDSIANADSSQLDFMTGITGGAGNPSIDAEFRSRLPRNKDQRQLYNATRRIQGRMQNQGVAAARDMGASGINTVAEAKMYFQGMPQVDYSSPESMQQSIGDIQEYTNNYNQQYQVNVGGKRQAATHQASQSVSTGVHTSKSGIQFKVE